MSGLATKRVGLREWRDTILADDRVRGNTLGIALAVGMYADYATGGNCRPSVTRIGGGFFKNPRPVWNHIEKVQALGYLKVAARRDRRPTEYHLTVPLGRKSTTDSTVSSDPTVTRTTDPTVSSTTDSTVSLSTDIYGNLPVPGSSSGVDIGGEELGPDVLALAQRKYEDPEFYSGGSEDFRRSMAVEEATKELTGSYL